MNTIVQQPDALSFSNNLKKFEITASAEVAFELHQGETLILSEKYQPDALDHITIDVSEVIDRLLEVSVPTTQNILTEQALGTGSYVASIDDTDIPFKVVKGGVSGLEEMAEDFFEDHLLTWQPQEKFILQVAPEWIGVYTVASGTLQLKAYYADGSSYESSYATLDADKLYSINVSWSVVSAYLVGKSKSSEVLAWDVWLKTGGIRMTPVQRYQLRDATDAESLFVWANTLGGIDSASFTGDSEEDPLLEHRLAIFNDDSVQEYDIEKSREIRQSTGFLSVVEKNWIEDFFYSRLKYSVQPDGYLRRIGVKSSKILISSAADEFEFEFVYRYSTDDKLLNLDRTLSDLPAPGGLDGFFLTELLSGLTSAQYQGNLNLAVQSPFVSGWQRISFNELWNSALPTLVDDETITFINGKLRAKSGVISESRKPKHGFESEEDSEISFVSLTKTFTITALLDSEEIRLWNMGELLLKATEHIVVATEETYYIYYKDVKQLDLSYINTLVATKTSWDRDVDIPIAKVSWKDSVATLTDFRYLCAEVNHSPLVRFEDKPHPAEDIYCNDAGFEGVLDETDTDVLKALKKLSAQKPFEEALIGLVDNSNKIFTTTFQYVAGSTTVFRNGLEESTANYSEFLPSVHEKRIEFGLAPSNVGFTDKLKIRYIKYTDDGQLDIPS
jgi:hypothetical protein